MKVVHRDLKPDNIFVAETSIGALVKILDFGIAKIQNMQRGNTLATNMFIGTFHYASPEQVEVSQQLDGRSNIYSLGIILYEMLSGNNPFGLDTSEGEISQMTWAIAQASKPTVPLRQAVFTWVRYRGVGAVPPRRGGTPAPSHPHEKCNNFVTSYGYFC